MNRPGSRFGIGLSVVAGLHVVGAVTTVRAAETTPTGASGTYATLLILAVVGIAVVVAYMLAMRLRKPPRD